MIYLAYIGLAYVGWMFSVFTHNRCATIAGNILKEKPVLDLLYAIVFPVWGWSCKILFQ